MTRSEQTGAGERRLAGRNPLLRGEELEWTLSCCSANPALGCRLWQWLRWQWLLTVWPLIQGHQQGCALLIGFEMWSLSTWGSCKPPGRWHGVKRIYWDVFKPFTSLRLFLRGKIAVECGERYQNSAFSKRMVCWARHACDVLHHLGGRCRQQFLRCYCPRFL